MTPYRLFEWTFDIFICGMVAMWGLQQIVIEWKKIVKIWKGQDDGK